MAEMKRRARITFKDQKFTINVPDQGQLLALSFAHSSGMEVGDMLGIIGQVVHLSLGDKAWGLFMTGLAKGEYTGQDFQDLVKTIVESVHTVDETREGLDVASTTLRSGTERASDG